MIIKLEIYKNCDALLFCSFIYFKFISTSSIFINFLFFGLYIQRSDHGFPEVFNIFTSFIFVSKGSMKQNVLLLSLVTLSAQFMWFHQNKLLQLMELINPLEYFSRNHRYHYASPMPFLIDHPIVGETN